MKLRKAPGLSLEKPLLPRDGLEPYLMARLDIQVFKPRDGRRPFRIAVEHGDDKYVADGDSPEECADAVHAILLGMYRDKLATGALPAPPKLLEGGDEARLRPVEG